MKKAIVIILAILPIFLILTISLAGRIVAEFVYINVESVVFVDENDEIYPADKELKVGLGRELQLKAVVLPEKANNKKVTFVAITDAENPIVSVDENGLVAGLAYGRATVRVQTEERQKSATIKIRVTDEAVSGVTLNYAESSLAVGERLTLIHTINPATALNKRVVWSSSDETKVSVDASGMVLAKAPTGDAPVIVTVSTEDGGFTASCAVTVRDEDATIIFKQDSFLYESADLTDNKINLLDCVNFDVQQVAAEDIRFVIVSGSSSAVVLEDGFTLQFNAVKKMIIVRATDINNSDSFVEAVFMLVS